VKLGYGLRVASWQLMSQYRRVRNRCIRRIHMSSDSLQRRHASQSRPIFNPFSLRTFFRPIFHHISSFPRHHIHQCHPFFNSFDTLLSFCFLSVMTSSFIHIMLATLSRSSCLCIEQSHPPWLLVVLVSSAGWRNTQPLRAQRCRGGSASDGRVL
jgi:hypothetical protein